MTMVWIGVPILVIFMGLVMGIPFVYYLKRDIGYEALKDKPQEIRVKYWNGN